MKKRLIMILVGLILFLTLSSFSTTFRRVIIVWFPGDNISNFYYTTQHGVFRMNESMTWKGLTRYSDVEKRFERFKQCYPGNADSILYRTFKKEPTQFYNWFAFFTHPRYQLPYIDPKTVPTLIDKAPPTICPGEFY